MKSKTIDFDVAQAAARWLREHGYLVRWDNYNTCYRVVLEGINREDDVLYPTKFKTASDAYYHAFRMIAGEVKLP